MTASAHDTRVASLRTRSAIARLFIGLFLLVDLLLALFAALMLYREVTTKISFFMVALPGFLFFIALPLMASGLALMIWVHRAHANLHAEALEGLNFAPGWAATSFLVPVAGLIVPFRAMRELWNRSHGEPEHFAAVSVDKVSSWWTCYVAGVLVLAALTVLTALDRLTPFVLMTPPGVNGLFLLLALLLLAGSAWFLWRIVSAITLAQQTVTRVTGTFD